MVVPTNSKSKIRSPIMNLNFFIIFLTSLLTLTACVSNSSVPQKPIVKTESVTETLPEIKTPDGRIINLLRTLIDLPSSEMNKVALTPTVIASDTDISIHLENAEEFNYIFYKRNELNGALYGQWENTTELMPVRDLKFKVPTEKGKFVGLLSIEMKSGKSASYIFAIDVR
jgi:hypothetical protein